MNTDEQQQSREAQARAIIPNLNWRQRRELDQRRQQLKWEQSRWRWLRAFWPALALLALCGIAPAPTIVYDQYGRIVAQFALPEDRTVITSIFVPYLPGFEPRYVPTPAPGTPAPCTIPYRAGSTTPRPL